MKRKMLILALLTLSIITYAQSSRSVSSIKSIFRDKGYSLVDDYYLALSEGNYQYRTRKFYSSCEYVIVAFNTEYGVKDLDLYVQYLDGDTYKKDNDNTNYCVVRFQPGTTRRMKLKVKNYSSLRSGYAYDVHMLVFYK